jgi:NAD+ kinase
MATRRGKKWIVKRVLLVPHPTRTDAQELLSSAADFLERHGAQVIRWSVADLSAKGGAEFGVGELDLVVTLGGDGTVLRALQLVGDSETPIIAVNAGNLGYLTELAPDMLMATLERWLQGASFVEDDRMLLRVECNVRGVATHRFALNEAVVEKRESGHTVRVRVDIDDEVFTSFVADGVIVATPTGSTAYAFSARGPIISPRQRAVLMTPVSPHMLFDRSLVLAGDEKLRISVESNREVDLVVDGTVFASLAHGDTVTCTGAERVARFLRLEPRRFHRILKTKFGLADQVGGLDAQ